MRAVKPATHLVHRAQPCLERGDAVGNAFVVDPRNGIRVLWLRQPADECGLHGHCFALRDQAAPPNALGARARISSGVSSSLSVAIAQVKPNGSLTWP